MTDFSSPKTVVAPTDTTEVAPTSAPGCLKGEHTVHIPGILEIQKCIANVMASGIAPLLIGAGGGPQGKSAAPTRLMEELGSTGDWVTRSIAPLLQGPGGGQTGKGAAARRLSESRGAFGKGVEGINAAADSIRGSITKPDTTATYDSTNVAPEADKK